MTATLEAAPLIDAIDRMCADRGWAYPDICAAIGRRLTKDPATAHRALMRMKESGKLTLRQADDFATGLDLDLNLLYPVQDIDPDEDDDLSDLAPSAEPVVVTHFDPEAGEKNGNGNGHGDTEVSLLDDINDDGPPTRERILEYLEQHGGELRDRKGMLASHLREVLGVPGKAVSSMLGLLGQEGVIDRETRGGRTYRITLRRKMGQPPTANGAPKDFSRQEAPSRGKAPVDDEGTFQDREIEAMRWIVGTLLALDKAGRARVLDYVNARLS